MKYINIKKNKDFIRNYIKENENFNFLCHKKLSCFRQCCRNLNMFLYPYDILRIKKKLKISSSKFINKYTDLILRKENYFPDVLLRMDESNNMKCIFLDKTGCSIYDDRPYSCRIFPIEHAKIINSIDKSNKIISFFNPPSYCLGKDEACTWNLKNWNKNQDADIYNKMTIKWSSIKELFLVDPWGGEGPRTSKGKMAFMAAYNIDSFRNFLFNSSFLKRYKIEEKKIKLIKKEESELLNFGFDWIKFFIWGIRSNIIKNKN